MIGSTLASPISTSTSAALTLASRLSLPRASMTGPMAGSPISTSALQAAFFPPFPLVVMTLLVRYQSELFLKPVKGHALRFADKRSCSCSALVAGRCVTRWDKAKWKHWRKHRSIFVVVAHLYLSFLESHHSLSALSGLKRTNTGNRALP